MYKIISNFFHRTAPTAQVLYEDKEGRILEFYGEFERRDEQAGILVMKSHGRCVTFPLSVVRYVDFD